MLSQELTPGERRALELERDEKIAAAKVEFPRRIQEIDSQLARLPSPSGAELSDELARLRAERANAESALSGDDYRDKAGALSRGAESLAREKAAALQAQLTRLQGQYDALNAIGDLTVEELIAKIQAGDAANAAAMEAMQNALRAYCDALKNGLAAEITAMEEMIARLQRGLNTRIDQLDNRLKYALKTDEELADLLESADARTGALGNQIAELEATIAGKRAAGESSEAEEQRLAALTVQYDQAKNDQDDLSYILELRRSGELSLHRRWIIELQELTAALRRTVADQGETIAAQRDEIDALQSVIANLETALRDEMSALKQELTAYNDDRAAGLNSRLHDLGSQISTLRDHVMTLATSSYSAFGSATTGNNSYNYSGGANKDELEDDRDLRTSGDAQIDF